MRAIFRRRRTWIGIAVSLFALAFAARGVQWADLSRSLAEADYRWLLPAGAVVVLGQFVRALRWQRLFSLASRPPFRDAFAVLSVGYLVSTVLPLRLGDPVRAWAMRRYSRPGAAESLATVMVERVLDLLTILLLLALMAPRPGAAFLARELGPGPWSDPSLLLALALLLLLLTYVGIVLAASGGDAILGFLQERLASRAMPASRSLQTLGVIGGLLDGLRPLRHPGRAFQALAWSMLVWYIGALSFWIVMFAFDIDLPLWAATFVMFIVAIAAVLPSTPSYAGVFHLAVVKGVDLISDYGEARALSYALVLHALSFGVLIVIGPIGLKMLGMGASELEAGVSRSSEAAQA